jgi:soluble lytic murein transglycosylase-like protein
MEVHPRRGVPRFPSTRDPISVIQQMESSNRVGVVGPMTKWGTAKGSMQLLDGTAQGVAEQLGITWRPDLMTAKTPEAAQYQQTLGSAYFQQGLEATGNYFDAARYYHGGPNRAGWGPKTNAYAQHFVSQIGAK